MYFGDPTQGFSIELAQRLVYAGADILEIGIPYSDPVCDGAVFQRACARALAQDMHPLDVINNISGLRGREIRRPIYLTSYYAPIFATGLKKFMKEAKLARINGLIVPDLLYEEQEDLLVYSKEFDIPIVQFITPYSADDRIRFMLNHADDFVYCIALPSVTGSRQRSNRAQEQLLKRIKRVIQRDRPERALPDIYVGFGIRTAKQVRNLCAAGFDGVIVGSSIARIYEKSLDAPHQTLHKVGEFIKELKAATMAV